MNIYPKLKSLSGILFVPAMITLTLSSAIYLIFGHDIHFVFIPNMILVFIVTSILESKAPNKKHQINIQDLKKDFFFILLNPILVPPLWYITLYQLFNFTIEFFAWIPQQNLLTQMSMAFFIMQFFKYWIHRWQHEIPWLWKMHAVHHGQRKFYTLSQFVSHPIDYFLRGFLPLTLVVPLGFRPEAIALVGALATATGMISHSNLKFKNKFWNYIFPTYEIHRWHHSILPKEANTNYGVDFLLFDHLFGTFFYPQDREGPAEYGVHDFPTQGTWELIKASHDMYKTDR